MDETLPLLVNEIVPTATPDSRIDDLAKCDVVRFNPEGDAENPLDWPKAYKWGIVLLLALMHFTVYV